ncbi:stromal interaction molecule homolog isoform X2 [Phlebotomus papatasi]|uniref:stromal interaction molecule homolog isoform X2 n=1 Tax=Phlebotomus papatasi TaxID=29031 RepID=UPI002483F811|nr:stromal interaction molecule homolog isoform X2 [Phlebotomus papatasi]
MRWLQKGNTTILWLFLSALVQITVEALETSGDHIPEDLDGQKRAHTPTPPTKFTPPDVAAGGVPMAGGQMPSGSPPPHFGPAPPNPAGGESRSSYAMLSQAMSKAVSHEFSSISGSGSPDGSCHADDLDCFGTVHDRLEMEAIRSLHQQLDDDDNGNIDIAESDDFLREELKYDSGYEKRHRAFHYNDDMHISVKELWEAWLRSEVHNWTVEQTTEWLAQSVQLPQYVELFKQHKVAGATLPRLAVNNMHYVGNVLGIKDPIHKQKIALKAMDVVLFGPPRETGTRWKDYILVTLLLSVIFGCWYGYQQNKNSKTHLRRMAKDMEGLQKAEQALLEMQKELERARMEQENVATEKMDLERRLKETPSLTSSSSDLEVQALKQEIEMLRTELSRAEIELVDHCWSPPQGLQTWLQLTYELENKNHLVKRRSAEKQLQAAREACEKLKRKRTSLVGAFVSTHGKSIDDVDRSIVEARNALGEVTNELQERMHRWKQIEQLLGFSIVNNNGLPYLESILYARNGGITAKTGRGRISNSQDDLDDDSTQASEDGDINPPVNPVKFTVGSGSPTPQSSGYNSLHNIIKNADSLASLASFEEATNRHSCERILPRDLPRVGKKLTAGQIPPPPPPPTFITGKAPMPPPRRSLSSSFIKRSQSTDMVPVESPTSTTSLISSSSTITSTVSELSSTSHGQHETEDVTPPSTDSSTVDDEFKKRRRKLHFPSFGRKSSKNKSASFTH